jgi:hypothetical protein
MARTMLRPSAVAGIPAPVPDAAIVTLPPLGSASLTRSPGEENLNRIGD